MAATCPPVGLLGPDRRQEHRSQHRADPAPLRRRAAGLFGRNWALRVKESCDVRIAWQVDVSPPIKMIGVGMIIMLLLDAAVVRALLVPATMRLLGRYNWWAPRPFARLWDRYGHREHSEPTAARPPLVLEPPCLARHPNRAGACAAGRAGGRGAGVCGRRRSLPIRHVGHAGAGRR